MTPDTFPGIPEEDLIWYKEKAIYCIRQARTRSGPELIKYVLFDLAGDAGNFLGTGSYDERHGLVSKPWFVNTLTEYSKVEDLDKRIVDHLTSILEFTNTNDLSSREKWIELRKLWRKMRDYLNGDLGIR